MTQALRESVAEVGFADLSAAREHLDRALTHLGQVGDRLDDYLTAIGVATVGDTVEETLAPTADPKPDATEGPDWWNKRINHISDGDAKADRSEVPLTKLFSELVELAGRGDRDAYRARLLAAGPAAGVKLSGLSWPMIRTLSIDILTRSPGESDDDKLTRYAKEPVRKLLPKLPPDVMLGQLRGANSLPHTRQSPADRSTGPDGPHPADAAAVGPILVSALLRARDTAGKER